jgi:hypothetical protein
MICTPHWVYFGWSNQENKMGRVCCTYREEEYIRGLWDETWRKDFLGASHRLEDDTKIVERNRMAGCGLNSSVLVYKQVASCCEHCAEPSGSINLYKGNILTSWGAVLSQRLCSMHLILVGSHVSYTLPVHICICSWIFKEYHKMQFLFRCQHLYTLCFSVQTWPF